jgi:hypothetical protein
MPRPISVSNRLSLSGEGSSQQELRPAANNRQLATWATLPVITTIIQDMAAPAQTNLAAAGARFVIKRNPTFNLILKPIVSHASAPDNLWGECMVVGVRELPWAGGDRDTKYVREIIGTLKFQGGAATFTSTEASPVEGIGTSAAVFTPCDVAGATSYVPSPEIMVIGEVVGGGISFTFDGWSYPIIELYPSCTLPSGESGSAASGITFLYTEC